MCPLTPQQRRRKRGSVWRERGALASRPAAAAPAEARRFWVSASSGGSPRARDNPCPDAPPSDNFWVSPFAQPCSFAILSVEDFDSRLLCEAVSLREGADQQPGAAGKRPAPRSRSAPPPQRCKRSSAAGTPAHTRGRGAGRGGTRREGCAGAGPALGADSHMPPCLKRLRGAGGERQEAQTAPQVALLPPRPEECRGASPVGRPRERRSSGTARLAARARGRPPPPR